MMSKEVKSEHLERSQAKMDSACLVSDRVQIQDVVLVKSSAESSPFKLNGPARFDVKVDVQTSANRERGVIVVRARFGLEARDQAIETEVLLQIAATFHVFYQLQSFEGLSDDNIEAFGELNGVFNAWPYWREFVQSTTVRMGLPPLTLPVYHAVS